MRVTFDPELDAVLAEARRLRSQELHRLMGVLARKISSLFSRNAKSRSL